MKGPLLLGNRPPYRELVLLEKAYGFSLCSICRATSPWHKARGLLLDVQSDAPFGTPLLLGKVSLPLPPIF